MDFKVQFFKSTKARYNSITPDEYTFYYITDTQQVFLGSVQLSNTDFSTLQNQVNQIIQHLNEIEQSQIGIIRVTSINKDQIESKISENNKFYLYINMDGQGSSGLKVGDGINYVRDLSFIGGSSSAINGIPQGGTTGQILAKRSNSNYDVGWVTGGGGGSGSPDSYVHQQMIPASQWIINHNLGFYPSVTVIDSANNVVIGDVNYTSINQIILTFRGSFSGIAYLS